MDSIGADDQQKHTSVENTDGEASQQSIIQSTDLLSIEDSKNIIENSIPTAIVKPKYQKSSYDEKQLPPVAYVNREKPWYEDNNNVNDTVVTTTVKKIQKLPPFERKSSKQLKHLTKSVHASSKTAATVASTSTTVSAPTLLLDTKERLNSLMECEKDIDNSVNTITSVAIVQPRKKDSMEELAVSLTKDGGEKCPTIAQKIDGGAMAQKSSIIISNNGKNACTVRPKPTPKPRSKAELKHTSGKSIIAS